MKKAVNIIFCIFILFLLSVPLLHFLGVREDFVILHGVEQVPPAVVLNRENFEKRIFQKNFEELYAKEFFLRKTFLKIKNQLYAWGNFGYFHSSYSGSIFAGKGKWLFERGYLPCMMKPSIEEKPVYCFEQICTLAEELEDRGIDFIYILATDKVRMYPEKLPWLYKFLFEDLNQNPHKEYGKILEKYNIPYLDSHNLLVKRKKDFRLFPPFGTHWTPLAASLVIEEMIKRLNENKPQTQQYPVVTPLYFAKTSQPRYAENDLGDLTNLLFPPPQKGSNPVFAPPSSKPCKATIFGDSFSVQISRVLSDSKLYTINYFQNHMPEKQEFLNALANSKIFVLVYTTPKLFNPTLRHNHIKTITGWIKSLPTKSITLKELHSSFSTGFYKLESRGCWASSSVQVRLPRRKTSAAPYRFVFSGKPLSSDQIMVIKDPHGKILKTIPLPQNGKYSFTLSAEECKNGVLRFEFPKARKPGNGDVRTLSFYFYDIKITPLPNKK